MSPKRAHAEKNSTRVDCDDSPSSNERLSVGARLSAMELTPTKTFALALFLTALVVTAIAKGETEETLGLLRVLVKSATSVSTPHALVGNDSLWRT